MGECNIEPSGGKPGGGFGGLASEKASGDNEDSREFEKRRSESLMVQLTETAVTKVKEILDTQEPRPAGLRIAVVGGGCSGFSYSMAFENTPNMLDKTYSFDGLKVFIDQASLLYLDGAEVDYVENMEGSGFKFNNPNVKSTCGCGSSFSA
jgi:iron-sulfur cluster assembly accessory protein